MDPLNEQYAKNFDAIPSEKTKGPNKEIRQSIMHQAFMGLVNYIKDAVEGLLYYIPKLIYRYRLSGDIEQLSFKNLELLEGYDKLAQDHVSQFQMKIENLWNSPYPEATLSIFKENLNKKNATVHTSFGTLYSMTVKHPIPGITKEDKQVITMLYDKYVRKTGNNTHNKDSLDNITIRDVKVYYNVCVKCMNYAVASDGLIPTDLICNAFEVFNNFSRSSQLHLVDEKRLKDNKGFVSLLKMLKPHTKLDVYELNYEPLVGQSTPVVIKLLIEKFINGVPFKITYKGIQNLTLAADSIHRILKNIQDQPPIMINFFVLKISKELGLVDADVANKINAFMHAYINNLSHKDEYSKQMLEEEINDLFLENNIETLRSIVYTFPHVVHQATRSIEVPFSELFENLRDNDI